MGLTISSLFSRLFGKKQMRILMGKGRAPGPAAAGPCAALPACRAALRPGPTGGGERSGGGSSALPSGAARSAGGGEGGDGAGGGGPFLGTALPPRPGSGEPGGGGGAAPCPLRAVPAADPGGGEGRPCGDGARELRGLRRGLPEGVLSARAVPRAPGRGRAALFAELGSARLGGLPAAGRIRCVAAVSECRPTDKAVAAEDSHREIAVQKVTGGTAAFRTSSSAPLFLLRFASLRVPAAARPRASTCSSAALLGRRCAPSGELAELAGLWAAVCVCPQSGSPYDSEW